MTSPDVRPSRPFPKAARVLLSFLSLSLILPAFLVGRLSPPGSTSVLETLAYVALTTALTLAVHRFAPRLDPRLRLHVSPFLTAAALAYTGTWWGYLAGLLFSASPTP